MVGRDHPHEEEPHPHLRVALPSRPPFRSGRAARTPSRGRRSSRCPAWCATSSSPPATSSTPGPSTASAPTPRPSTTIPVPMAEPRLELEGEELLFSDDWEGDSVNNSVVWVPSHERPLRHGRRLRRLERVVHREQRRAAGQVASGPRPAQGVRCPRGHPRPRQRQDDGDPRAGGGRPLVRVHLLHRLDAGVRRLLRGGVPDGHDRASSWPAASESVTRTSGATTSPSSGWRACSSPRVAPSGSRRCPESQAASS